MTLGAEKLPPTHPVMEATEAFAILIMRLFEAVSSVSMTLFFAEHPGASADGFLYKRHL